MHRFVRPVVHRLKIVLSRFRTVPDLCHISFSTFAMELTKLNDRIAELVANSNQRGTEIPIRKLELQTGMHFSEAECEQLLSAIESHFQVTLTDNDRRLLKNRGYTLFSLWVRFHRRAKFHKDLIRKRSLRAAA